MQTPNQTSKILNTKNGPSRRIIIPWGAALLILIGIFLFSSSANSFAMNNRKSDANDQEEMTAINWIANTDIASDNLPFLGSVENILSTPTTMLLSGIANAYSNTNTTQTSKQSNNTASNDVSRNAILQKLAEIHNVQTALAEIAKIDSSENTGVAFSFQEAAKKVDSLGKGVDNIVSKVEKIQNERKENEILYNTVLSQIKKVVIDIRLTKQSVSQNVMKINILTKRMVDTLARLDQAKQHIKNSQDTLMKLLPALYMLQNNYTDTEGNIDDIKLLLGKENLSEALSYDDMVQSLSIKLDTLLQELTTAQEKYIKDVQEMHQTRKDLKRSTLAYYETIETLEEQKAYLVSFLDLYQNKQISLDRTLSNLFETKKQLQTRISALVESVEKTKGPLTVSDGSGVTHSLIGYSINDASFTNFLLLKDDRETRDNFLGRPILPVKSILHVYGEEISFGGTPEINQGIQLNADQGQEIYAPANGYVYYAHDQDGIGINWVMLIHNNGYITVFTNVQRVLVKEKDIVKRGEIIGLAGGQPGTRGAGWFSNASSLSMQVFKNGKPIDPLNALDLSIFSSVTALPIEFAYKYETDTQNRNKIIDLSDIKYVTGNTDFERRNNFLTQYAKAPYDDIMLREKAAEGTNIDVDLGICIGYAETSLGRAFASENNIGNVGNNDRGDRVDKESPLIGAKAIYVTLNNGYLGGYNTIFELSGYGNKEGAIYASSEYNWQKNVSRCLSTIKGYVVPEDYPFRTYTEN